jgi:hypothetical protein
MTPNTIYNNAGRHFRVVRDRGFFLHRKQVEAHHITLLEKGECKGECATVFEGKEFSADRMLPRGKQSQAPPVKEVSFDRLNELKKQLYSTMCEVVEEIGRLEAALGLQRK